MPFKNRWSRLFHKSDAPSSSSSSSSSSGRTDDIVPSRWGVDRKPVSHVPKAVAHSAAGPNSRVSSLASSRFSRMTSWRSSTATNSSSSSTTSAASNNSGVSSRGNRNPGPHSLNLHPSERPLTEQNLRHQEVLGRFTMKVAQRKAQRTGETSPRSPRDSRSMSLDMAAAMSRGRTFETAFRDWKIDERGEDEEAAEAAEVENLPLHRRRITEESISV